MTEQEIDLELSNANTPNTEDENFAAEDVATVVASAEEASDKTPKIKGSRFSWELIFKDVKNKSHMYFVHSYEFIPEDKSVISATTEYSSKIVCSVERENLFGTQFHPEKSDKFGLKIIDNFINL